MFVSHAVVPIERPARWAKQLAEHFGNKTTVEDVPEGKLIHLSVGEGIVGVSDDAVLLTAKAESAELLDKVEDVLGRHLERFAQKLNVTVVWGASQTLA